MIPVIGLIRIGKARWTVPLPLPVFLAWPFVLVALARVTLTERLVNRRSTHSKLTMARGGLSVLCQLSGLKIDVRSTDGSRVFVWFF